MNGKLVFRLIVAISLLACAELALAQEQTGSAQGSNSQEEAANANRDAQLRALNWIKGPRSVELFSNSGLTVPQDYVFLGTEDTSKLQSLEQNLGNGSEYFFAPKDFHWQAFFRFSDDGYVKDDEKIDADAILKHISDSTEQGNKARRDRGWDEMEVLGWQTRPYYDAQTHHLEWAILGRDKKSGEQVVNFNTRILGRSGVTSVVLVSAPESLPASISELKNALSGFDFHAGQRYAEYKAGDKVATYGLAALITGGAAAVAVKTGFWKVIVGAVVAGWKFIVAAIVALFGGISRLFKRKTS